MRLFRFVFLALLVGAFLVACSPHVDNANPTITLVTPETGATVALGDEIAIAGTAHDNKALSRVQLTIGDDVRVASGLRDWTYTWAPTAAGEYQVRARAYDEAGLYADSESVTITVVETPVAGGVSGVITRTAAETEASTPAQPEAAPVVPGEVFVVFKQGRPDTRFGIDATGPASEGGFTFHEGGGFSTAGLEFEQLRAYPLDSGLSLYRASGLSESGTLDLVETLRASNVVQEAFPNWILTTNAVPDDPNYLLQAWHYQQINMENAWDIEDGTSNTVTVAVLDSGAFPHPDLEWGTGANLVNWGDQGGVLGPDPTEGDITNFWTNLGNSPHGTHVAGTIGALTNNTVGVAGINWNVELLPVKVLGGAAGSGSLAGILEGAWWAAGYPGEEYGGHVNESPAQVLNLSLGGTIFEACPAELDETFAFLASLGVTTVVSAGNNGSPSDINFPASCPSVITVGATGPTAARAYYSNYGAFVDVMAPGGDADYAHPLMPSAFAGVLSTYYDSADELPVYSFSQGTSMAAPHVTGVVSLMLAQDPTLTPEEIRERLHNASYPLTQAECNVPAFGFEGQNVCGAGLLDAAAALNGDTVTAPTATAYAIAYEGETPPDLGIGNLAALELIATNKAEGTPLPSGDFAYEFSDLAPGRYLIVGLELRDASTGVSSVDRVGFVDEVDVVAGAAEEVNVVVAPIYATLR